MTEEEFKSLYKKSFLEAYKSAVSIDADFGKIPSVQELLAKANDHANRAWIEYLKDINERKS